MHTAPEDRRTCPGCHRETDPDICWCGSAKDDHIFVGDHPFIPLGCDCYRAKAETAALTPEPDDSAMPF